MRLRVILRKLPSADILPEWKIDVLGRRSSNPAGSVEASTYTEKEKETNIGWVRERREREREKERDCSLETKIPVAATLPARYTFMPF